MKSEEQSLRWIPDYKIPSLPFAFLLILLMCRMCGRKSSTVQTAALECFSQAELGIQIEAIQCTVQVVHRCSGLLQCKVHL